jgi:hypothetical protein
VIGQAKEGGWSSFVVLLSWTVLTRISQWIECSPSLCCAACGGVAALLIDCLGFIDALGPLLTCHCLEITDPAAMNELLSNLISTNRDTRNGAVADLVDYCSYTSSLKALLPWEHRIADACEDLLDPGARGDVERHELAFCMSRMACVRVTNQAEWDEATLQSCLRNFSDAEVVEKRMKLRAVRLFIVANKDKVALVEDAGWVTAALECEAECYDDAVLLLDALQSLASLPALVMGAAGAEAMLMQVISRAGERERCAALRVCSHVLSSLEPGMRGAAPPLEARDVWLNKLYRADIVEAVVACIERFTTRALVGSAVRTLTFLSKHSIFLRGFRDYVLMRTIVSQVLAKGQALRDIFIFFRQVLTFNEVADAFSSSDGPLACVRLLANGNPQGGTSKDVLSLLYIWLEHATSPDAAILFTRIDGPKECLAFLEKADLEKAQGALDVLIAWCDKRPNRDLAGQQGMDWSPLVRFLAVGHRATVEKASALILWNWYFPGQDDGAGSAVLQKVVEHKEGLPLLFYYFGDSHLIRRHLRDAVWGIDGLTPILGKDLVALCGAHGVTRLGIGLARSDEPDVVVAPAIYCLGILASNNTNVMSLVVNNKIFGAIVRRLDAQVISDDPVCADLMLKTMVTLLEAAGRQGIKVSRLMGGAEIPALKMLLKVSLSQHPPH